MRRLAIAAGMIAIAALALTGCAPARDAGGADPQLRGQWELQSGNDSGGKIPVADQRITLTIAGDKSTNGRSSCADYTAHVLGSPSHLWVTASLPHQRLCTTEAQRELELRYIDDLNKVSYANVTKGTLTLQAPGLELDFDRALPLALKLVTNRTWEVQSVGQDPTEDGGVISQIYLHAAWLRLSDHGKLTGADACRTFSGRWTQNAGEIVVSDFGSAKTATCSPDDVYSDLLLRGMLTMSFTWHSFKGLLYLDSPRAGVNADLTEHIVELGQCTQCTTAN